MQFQGFPKQTLPFLEAMQKNNNKEWFTLHKEEYNRYILEPSKAFVVEMGEELFLLTPHIRYAPKYNHSLFKIYRDTRRMGYDKRPLKERIGFIWWEGVQKRLQSSSFYCHFDTKTLFVSVGIRWFETPNLKRYRIFLEEKTNQQRLQNIITSLEKKGYNLLPKELKRYPKGLQGVELALYKSMAMYKELPSSLIEDGEKLIEKLFTIYEDMLPLQQIVYEITQIELME